MSFIWKKGGIGKDAWKPNLNLWVTVPALPLTWWVILSKSLIFTFETLVAESVKQGGLTYSVTTEVPSRLHGSRGRAIQQDFLERAVERGWDCAQMQSATLGAGAGLYIRKWDKERPRPSLSWDFSSILLPSWDLEISPRRERRWWEGLSAGK